MAASCFLLMPEAVVGWGLGGEGWEIGAVAMG